MKKHLAFAAVVLVSAPASVRADASIFSPYGFLLGTASFASHSVESFANANLSAPIAASPPGILEGTRSRRSIEVAQTRIGTYIKPGAESKVSGQIELDFIDFTKASPTTKALPRLRIGKISWQASEHNLLELGQDWDVFSPGKPYTYNFVGLYFNTGNAGFMRQQLKFKHSCEGGIDLTSALGLPGNNNNAGDSDLERELVPSFSASVAKQLGQKSTVGLSAIGGQLSFSDATGSSILRRGFYGLNGFFGWKESGSPEVSVEGYYGQNLGNTGALTLASGDRGTSLHEAGAYATVAVPIAGAWTGYGGLGYAAVVEPQGDSAGSSVASERRQNNGKLEAGFTVELAEHLKLFAQQTVFRTRYVAATTGGQSIQTAALSEAGLHYAF